MKVNLNSASAEMTLPATRNTMFASRTNWLMVVILRMSRILKKLWGCLAFLASPESFLFNTKAEIIHTLSGMRR